MNFSKRKETIFDDLHTGKDRHRGLQITIILFFIFILISQLLFADTTCVPIAAGVPYSLGPPKWWITPSSLSDGLGIYDRIDDPRWRGACSITDGGMGIGAGEDMEFRALYHSGGGESSLYFSFWQKTFPGAFTPYDKFLYLGFRKSVSSSEAVLIKIEILADDVTNSNLSADRSVEFYNINDQGVIESQILPGPGDTWPDRIHVWADVTSNMWAVHMNIPLHAGLLGAVFSLEDDFDMWYEICNISPTYPELYQYTWPRGEEYALRFDSDDTQTVNDTLPAPVTWPRFHLSSGSSDPLCGTGGITIAPLDIGSKHPGGASYIYTNTTETNTFFAKPTNLTDQPYDSTRVHATFYLANWGLQPEYTVWDTIPGLEDVSQSIAGAVNPGDRWNIQDTWTLTLLDSEQYSLEPHQCMYVQLYGKDLKFLRNSVYRNMDFVDLTFTGFSSKSAQINVHGLPKKQGQQDFKRDVYIFVQAKNMPRSVDQNNKKGLSSDFTLKNLAAKIDSIKQQKKLITKEKYDIKNVEWLVNIERPVMEQISRILPTYLVRGYYDTGRRIKTQHGEKVVLRPMTSFGYFVLHKGEVPGWKHSIQGEGLEKLGNNLYKINVDSVATITTTIEIGEPPIPCWVWICIIIVILLIIIWIIKRIVK
jgi:hypothetical protein